MSSNSQEQIYTPPEIGEKAKAATNILLPVKSRERSNENDPILRKLIFGPSMSITVKQRSTSSALFIKEEPKVSSSYETGTCYKNHEEKQDSESETSLKRRRCDLKKQNLKRKRLKENDALDKSNNVNEITEAIQCEICENTFKDNLDFGLHSIKHSTNQRFCCHMCKYSSASKYHFEMHIRAHEGNTKYKCEVCNKAFTVSTHAIEHKYFHTGEKPFQCEICGKHFMFSWFLSSHRRSQHWEVMTGMPLVKYDCLICNKHYTSSTGLKRHKISKHNDGHAETSVLCDICGKRLASKEKLKFHRRIHTGYKPYSCEFCNKSFSRKEQLKEHERIHTGEKPYICKFCGKGFTQRSPLRIHERTHTGERPYVCRLCNKGYISKGVMDTHMKNCQGLL